MVVDVAITGLYGQNILSQEVIQQQAHADLFKTLLMSLYLTFIASLYEN